MKKLIIFLSLPFLIHIAAAVQCGDVITGKLILEQHLTNCGKAGLILSSNANLDCNGFAIRGRGINQSIGIGIEGDNVTVKNCESYDFSAGIFAKDTTRLSIQHFIMVEKGEIGILLSNVKSASVEALKLRDLDSGLSIRNSADISVMGGNLSAGRGIVVEDSESVSLDRLFVNNSAAPIRIRRGNSIYLSDSLINGGEIGSLLENSKRTRFNSVTLMNSSLRVSSSTFFTLENCRIMAGRLLLERSNHSIIRGNAITDAPVFGIELSPAEDTLVEDNTISGATNANILVGHGKNTVISRNVITNSHYGIFNSAEGATLIVRNLVLGNDFGVWLDTENESAIAGNAFQNTYDINGDRGSGVAMNNLFSTGKWGKATLILALNRYFDPFRAFL